MDKYAHTNDAQSYLTFEKMKQSIADMMAIPKDFFCEKKATTTITQVMCEMTLEVVKPKLFNIFFQPTPSEKLEANLKAWHWVNKYRRRNLACKIGYLLTQQNERGKHETTKY